MHLVRSSSTPTEMILVAYPCFRADVADPGSKNLGPELGIEPRTSPTQRENPTSGLFGLRQIMRGSINDSVARGHHSDNNN